MRGLRSILSGRPVVAAALGLLVAAGTWAATIGTAAAADACPPEAIAVSTTPVPMQRVDKMKGYLKQMTAVGGPVDVLLVGDSLSENWNVKLAPLSSYKVGNFGLGADTTQNVLWRLDQMGQNELNPSIILMFLGTNNLGNGDPACGITEGIRRVLDKSHAMWPKAFIVFFAIPPRGPLFDYRDDVRIAVNKEIEGFATDHRWVEYLNVDDSITCGMYRKTTDLDRLTAWFLPPVARCSNYRSDGIHITDDGYRVLGEVIGSERKHK